MTVDIPRQPVPHTAWLTRAYRSAGMFTQPPRHGDMRAGRRAGMTHGAWSAEVRSHPPLFHDPRLEEIDVTLLDNLGDYRVDFDDEEEPILLDKDGNAVETWRENYPYPQRMSREQYDREKRQLQIELLKLQKWIKLTGAQAGDPLRGPRRRRQGRHDQAVHRAPEPARGGASWRWRSRASASRPSGTSSATSSTCRPPVRSSCSTGPGTTGPASSGSWASAPAPSTWSSCARRRSWSGCWSAPASTW